MIENAFIKLKTLLVIFCVAAAAVLILYFAGVFEKPAQPVQNEDTSQELGQQLPTSTPSVFVAPIGNWQARVTKKPFGIYITPQNSPVSPEKFSGYHTGVDFETFTDEQNIDVPVYAVCDGPLILKQRVSGYGGVVVQACQFDGQDLTILYGHLKLASINFIIGDQLGSGEQIGILGEGFSSETDGERKHLHLGIHKGTAINFLGYAQNQADLKAWLDVTKYLK